MKKIMSFQIFLDASQITNMKSPYGEVTFIPFTGKVDSELFSGETVPGAVDVQVTNPAGIRNLCAKYMFKGKDYKGEECFLFVENNGYIAPSEKDDAPMIAYPKFMTDSTALGEYLCQSRFCSEIHGTDFGVEIWIYDKLSSSL